MIGYLNGVLADVEDGLAVIDVNGVGYEVLCTNSIWSKNNLGAKVAIYIQTIVREDAISFFGFESKFEKQWFNLLTTVQGVGAKLAMAILNHYPAESLSSIILGEDITAVKAISGVGPKLALRIITELKSKKELSGMSAGSISIVSQSVEAPDSSEFNDALMALVNLGFARKDVYSTLKDISASNDNLGLEEYVRKALGKLSSM